MAELFGYFNPVLIGIIAIAGSAQPVSANHAELISECAGRLIQNERSSPVGERKTRNGNSSAISHPIPGVLKFEMTGPGRLTYLGVPHVRSPDPILFSFLEQAVKHQKPDIIYLEVADTGYLQSLPDDRDHVINARGEPSYMGYIAKRQGISIRPLEPNTIQLYEKALLRNFSFDQIALAHILRSVQIRRDRRGLSGRGLELAAKQAIADQEALALSLGKKMSFSTPRQLSAMVRPIWPQLNWQDVSSRWFNPLLRSSETGSHFINDIFLAAKNYRDEHGFKTLSRAFLKGENVLAMVGRNHLESQISALRCVADARSSAS